MDLRVYVDGVARIICDLTRKTTVHDIIIALAQYKGKAGRYSLIECSPDGTQRTLSPNELTCELVHHPDWVYILRQNLSNKNLAHAEKRSKSLDGRKTPIEQQPQTIIDTVSALNQSSGYFRAVSSHHKVPSTSTSQNRKRSHLHQIFPTINKTNVHLYEPLLTPPTRRRLSRTPVQNFSEHHQKRNHSRPKSAVPSAMREKSAFHLVPNNVTNQHQQDYITLLNILKAQDMQLEKQKHELRETQKEIDYYDALVRQGHANHENIQHELRRYQDIERRLFSECQILAQEYSTEKLENELEYHRKLNSTHENLQQQLARCLSTLEQKKQVQEQIQCNIEQMSKDIEEAERLVHNEKKELSQCEIDIERSNSAFKQGEDVLNAALKHNDDIERTIQQRRKQIVDLENKLSQVDDLLMNSFVKSPYHFNSTTPTDVVKPGQLQLVNSTLLKFCPNGIWV